MKIDDIKREWREVGWDPKAIAWAVFWGGGAIAAFLFGLFSG